MNYQLVVNKYLLLDYLLVENSSISLLKELINSNEYSINHIVNFSLRGIKSETMLHALEEDEIYISTQTACSTGDYSLAVYAVTKDEKRSASSMRVSINYLTTKEEIDLFIDSLSIQNLKKSMI